MENTFSQTNKALIRQFYNDVFNDWNFKKSDELLTADFKDHDMPPGIPAGPEGFRQFYGMLRTAFPDLRYSVQELIAEDDKVVVQWTWHGTHQGEFFNIPATGRDATTTGIAVYRISQHKIAERWVKLDMLGLLSRLRA
jgi:steroid delta-isomerase-like uncharacterized protein